MGSYGDTITQPIPPVGTSGVGYATQINAFLTEVKNRLQSKVPGSSVMYTSQIDWNNQNMLNAARLGLYPGTVAPSGSPTRAFAEFGGDVYWVGLSGAVKLTDGANINAAGIRGIGGDYGGANPAAVNFVDANKEYDFYDDLAGAAFAHIKGWTIDLSNGSTGTQRVRIGYAGAGSYDTVLPAALPAAASVLTQDAAGVMRNDGVIATDLTLSGATKVKTGDRFRHVSILPGDVTGGTITKAGGIVQVATVTSGAHWQTPLDGLLTGERFKAVTFYFGKVNAITTTTIKVFRVNGTLGTSVQIGSTQNSSSAGIQLLTVSGLAETVAAGSSYYLDIQMGTVGDQAYSNEINYDQV